MNETPDKMNREQAEKLLAALIFDDLDEPSKAGLLAYLQADDELRDRLADIRMAVKLTCDAVNDGPDPVLSEPRLKRLKRLAKTHKPRTRIFAMRHLLSAAAVLAFGVVFVGLLMPSLSRRGVVFSWIAQTDKAPVPALAAEQRMQSLQDTGGPLPDYARPVMQDFNGDAYASTGGRRARGEMDKYVDSMMGGDGGMHGYGGMGGMGGYGMGGYGGGQMGGDQAYGSRMGSSIRGGGMMGGMAMGDGDVENRAVDSGGGLYFADRSDGRSSSLGVVSDELSVAQLGQPPTVEVIRGRKLNALDMSGLEGTAGNEQASQILSESNRRPYAGQPATQPAPAAVRSPAPARPSNGPQDAEMAGRRVAGGTPAEPGQRVVTYGFSGTLSPTKQPGVQPLVPPTPDSFTTLGSAGKPITAASAPLAADSLANSDRKASEAHEYGVINGAVADSRTPRLGDQPVVGELFKKSLSEVKQDLGKELQVLNGPTEMPSIAGSSPAGQVRFELTDEPVDHAGKLMQMDEAGVPYATEITYPKNWGEIRDKEKAQALRESEEAGVPVASRFHVVPVNPWVMAERDSLSTFALDVDTASYALCRQYIRSGFLPPVGAVRMEEFINAFDYAYPQRDDATFAAYAEGAPSPFAPAGQDVTLLKIAVKARTVGRDQRRAAHLVFVVDASASMGQADRLPAVQAALNLLVDKLSDADRVSLITCAGEARLHLEAVWARQKDVIRQSIEAIQPAGPTNLMAGIELGYAMARRAFAAGQINQVVLCSDGVANVGQTEAEAVLDEVAEDRRQGITLTCVGVGYGAYNDAFLEAMANRGDGRYVFLDSSEGARETLVGQLAATLEIVAKDARIQVEFNPSRVRRYRLIGYENRDIEDQRFRDDTIDAGEVGSGQCSTALYELELTSHRGEGVPPSNRGQDARDTDNDLGTVFVRYRNAETGQIEEFARPLTRSLVRRRSVEEDPRFFLAAGAARFAEWLRQSEHAQHTSLADIQRVLDDVSAALPLDQSVQDLAALARQAQGLPRGM